MNQKKETFTFPENFYWGASSAAHQVEGGNENSLTDWEKENCEILARKSKELYKIEARLIGSFKNWEKFEDKKKDPQNYISGKACDHYHLFENDFDLARSLNHNAHRFSIEWSRIEPIEGSFNELEIDHYREVLEALKLRGLEPFVTLFHFTLPKWFLKKGGWAKKENIKYFLRFVEKLAKVFKGDVTYWLTMNEPLVYVGGAYFAGAQPPEVKNIFTYFKVVSNLIEAHKQAYEILKKINPNFQVAYSKHNVYFRMKKKNLLNLFLFQIADYWWNHHFLDKTIAYQDFIGLNYYFYNLIHNGFNKSEKKIVSDMGNELYPQGLYFLLKDLGQRYQKPIYITENGLPDKDDGYRAWYIEEIIRAIAQAMKEKVEVKAYIHWSLTDNFEWNKGFWPRFGLVEIDFETQERKVRQSAFHYAKIIKQGEIVL